MNTLSLQRNYFKKGYGNLYYYDKRKKAGRIEEFSSSEEMFESLGI